MRRPKAVSRAALTFGVAIALIAPASALGAESFIIPAGEACSFDVLAEPEQKDGAAAAHMPIGFGNITLTNLDTGVSILTKSRYTLTETEDPTANVVVVAVTGRFFLLLIPGDQGPFGEVEEGAALFRIVGETRFTVDLELNVVTDFSIDGHATDICAQLAPQ
jgi:hypothetical protein